jgi:hypothetical protein
MPIAAMCPYFRYEKAGVTHCECGELRFPDRKARREVLYRYCAHPTDYGACPLKRAMDGYYERSL